MSNFEGFLADVDLLSIISISFEGGLLCPTSLLGLVMGEGV